VKYSRLVEGPKCETLPENFYRLHFITLTAVRPSALRALYHVLCHHLLTRNCALHFLYQITYSFDSVHWRHLQGAQSNCNLFETHQMIISNYLLSVTNS